MNREELFDKHLRGELTAAEAIELKRLLAQDPAAGRAFVEHTNETALLVRVGLQIQSTDNVVPLPSLEGRVPQAPLSSSEEKSGTRGTRLSKAVKWGALAACLLALAVLAISLTRKSPPLRIAEVHVTGAAVQVTRAGVLLRGGTIELRAGDIITTPTNETAVIAYEHESTRIEIHPGSVVQFGDAAVGKQFELRRGIIQARVAPQPAERPMRVETAYARATVLGTEFVMRADERATKLDVLEGKVQLACRESGKKKMVKAGFSATMVHRTSINVAPLCSSNCILKECSDTNTASGFQTREE